MEGIAYKMEEYQGVCKYQVNAIVLPGLYSRFLVQNNWYRKQILSKCEGPIIFEWGYYTIEERTAYHEYLKPHKHSW
jgi:hypothetical protein